MGSIGERSTEFSGGMTAAATPGSESPDTAEER
jgi:hypothetical protein